MLSTQTDYAKSRLLSGCAFDTPAQFRVRGCAYHNVYPMQIWIAFLQRACLRQPMLCWVHLPRARSLKARLRLPLLQMVKMQSHLKMEDPSKCFSASKDILMTLRRKWFNDSFLFYPIIHFINALCFLFHSIQDCYPCVCMCYDP